MFQKVFETSCVSMLRKYVWTLLFFYETNQKTLRIDMPINNTILEMVDHK